MMSLTVVVSVRWEAVAESSLRDLWQFAVGHGFDPPTAPSDFLAWLRDHGDAFLRDLPGLSAREAVEVDWDWSYEGDPDSEESLDPNA